MPIYAYRCDACGFRKDVLQKMSDPALTVCPSCGAESFAKQLSAPAFQLKGTGWYVTDFRDKGAKPAGAETGVAASGEAGAANGSDKGADRRQGATAKPADGKSNGKSAETAPAPAAPAAAKPEVKGGGSGASAGTSSGGSGAS